MALVDRRVLWDHKRLLCQMWASLRELYAPRPDWLAVHFHSATRAVTPASAGDFKKIVTLRKAAGLPPLKPERGNKLVVTAIPDTSLTQKQRSRNSSGPPCCSIVLKQNKPQWETTTHRLIWLAAAYLTDERADLGLVRPYFAWTTTITALF